MSCLIQGSNKSLEGQVFTNPFDGQQYKVLEKVGEGARTFNKGVYTLGTLESEPLSKVLKVNETAQAPFFVPQKMRTHENNYIKLKNSLWSSLVPETSSFFRWKQSGSRFEGGVAQIQDAVPSTYTGIISQDGFISRSHPDYASRSIAAAKAQRVYDRLLRKISKKLGIQLTDTDATNVKAQFTKMENGSYKISAPRLFDIGH